MSSPGLDAFFSAVREWWIADRRWAKALENDDVLGQKKWFDLSRLHSRTTDKARVLAESEGHAPNILEEMYNAAIKAANDILGGKNRGGREF